ncbi:hypothetical protein [Halomonas sp. E19]|uniref:hypothetical protein n=1 Tax=Halomonas sp. E19 TaxID=3397247 RepID=UPI00403384FA
MITRAALRTPDVIRQAREHLSRGRVSMDLLDASIGRSWQRCLEHGLRPGARLLELPKLDSSELRLRRETHRRLIELADPSSSKSPRTCAAASCCSRRRTPRC